MNKTTIIVTIIVMTLIGIVTFILHKINKLKPIIEYCVDFLKDKNIINKIKLLVLLNALREYTINEKVNNKWVKMILEIIWPKFDLLKTATKIEKTDNKNLLLHNIPNVLISKNVDEVLNETLWKSTTNLKIDTKDKGYLEGYMEGQINKLNESKIGIKAGIKF